MLFSPLCKLAVACMVGVSTVGFKPAWGQADDPIAPRKRIPATLEQRLNVPSQAIWDGVGVREALTNMTKAVGVAAVLDRRVDPGAEVRFALNGGPLRGEVKRLAEHLKLECTLIGPVVLLGPRNGPSSSASALALREAETAKLPAAAKSRWKEERPAGWPERTTPKELLQAAADDAGVRWESLDGIPHDLWAAAELPPMTAAARIQLIAGQYDLTFEILEQGAAAKLVPFPADLSPVVTLLDAVGPAGKGIQYDDKRKIEKLTVVNKPMIPVLGAIAQSLGLILRIEHDAIEEAGIDPHQLVSFEVRAASADDAVKAVLGSSGLMHRRTGPVVSVYPAPK